MPTQLRTRLLAGSLTTIALVMGLMTFIFLERRDLNTHTTRLVRLENAARRARELSLYVQYNAHDTNAYALGHLEHSQEFAEHGAAFHVIFAALHESLATGILDEHVQSDLDRIAAVRTEYERAVQRLFAAADADRAAPSAEHQAAVDAAWEEADQLSDQLDELSQELAHHLDADVQELEAEIDRRNQQLITIVLGLGIVISALVILIQSMASQAVGAPLRALLAGVRSFAAGDMSTRVAVRRHDEVGELAEAFNEMAARIQRQTESLVRLEVVEAARAEAEAARLAIAEQLATIEAQRAVIRDMSVPILPLTETTLVMPLVGSLDTERIRLVQEQALQTVARTSARHLILDVTGVPVVDTQVAQGLIQVVRAARLLGTEVLLVGIRPEMAQAIVGLGINLGDVATYSTLESGIAYALDRPTGWRTN